MKKLAACLVTALAVGWSSQAHAECTYADGTAAPAPGMSEQAKTSNAWGPRFVSLYNNLNKGDQATLDAMLDHRNSALVTSKCSPNDLFWTHLSLVGLSEEDPESLSEGLPEIARAFKLTDQGRRRIPAMLEAGGVRK
ncbi:MAG: hypothetical protein JJ899_08630 [Alphaproteobacteria bacterium]|nr:hypothetical protein [Alphaproteobacteria bacterium]